MLKRCSYQIIGSLVPPSPDEDACIRASQLRLENISSCVIVRSEKNCHILSKTPAHLFPILLRAFLRDSFYSFKFRKTKDLYGLFELILFWPYEELIVIDAIPNMPRRLVTLPSYWEPKEFAFNHYWEQNDFLYAFDSMIAMTIFNFLLNFPKFKKQKFKHKLKKIDLSEIHEFEYEYITELLDSFPNKHDSHIKCSNAADSELEVIVDIAIDEENHKYEDIVRNLDKFVNWCSGSSRKITLKYGKVSLCGLFPKADVLRHVERLVNERTKVIVLKDNAEGPGIIEDIFQTETKLDNIQALDLSFRGSSINSLDFLQHFKHLVHLKLSKANLHGRLKSLNQMHRGLLLLSLIDCYLYNDDLEELIGSCHQSTLRELDLSYNILRYDNHSSNLVKLCQNMPNLIYFSLAHSQLDLWPAEEIEKLLYSVNSMPSLMKLDFRQWEFSSDVVTVQLMVLKGSPSLRCLELSLPATINEYHTDLVKSFCSEISVKMNDMRSQLMYIDFADESLAS